jgi:signal transduction histidine kinase
VTSLLRRRPFDALVVALAAAAEVKVWIDPGEGPKAVFIVGTLLWTLPLLWRHRFPFAAPVFAFAAQAGAGFADPTLGVETTMTIAVFLTFWAVGAVNEGSQALVGAAIGFACLAVVAAADMRVNLEDAVSGSVMGGTVCLIAYALQRRTKHAAELEERAVRLEREREERTRAAIVEERKRIARELHDVIAHTVSVMTVQAGAARLLLDEDPARADAPLLAVEETGRQALAEIGRLFGILRDDGAEVEFGRQRGVADLDVLLERARRAGLSVELAVQGEPTALAPGVDLAAYRVVQEALTNELKHAGPARAQVTVRFGREALDLEIVNDGRVASNGEGSGHGLAGMRERVSLYGGELQAGAEPGGVFAVRARLPVEPGGRLS